MSGWYVDAADLLAEPDPGPTPWLVEGLIVDQAIVAAVGRWKTTKSYALLDLSIAIATGRRAFGRFEIPTAGPVVFINEESGRAALWRRLDALCRGRAIVPSELRGRLLVSANAGVKLDEPGWLDELKRLADQIEPRLFVFDPLARMKAASRDENKQTDMAVVIEAARALRDHAGAAICFVHHVGHGGGNMRGSSDLESFWETRLTWEREGQSLDVDLRSEHREAEAGPPVRYRISWDGATSTMRFDAGDPSAPTLAERILEYLEGHPKSKAREIASGIDVRGTDVDREIARLVETDKVDKSRSGRLDKVGRAIRDEVYSVAGRSSQTFFSEALGTNHGTSHISHGRHGTSDTQNGAESAQPGGSVARPTGGTNQDETGAGQGGSLPRPTPLGVGERGEPPDEAPDLDEDDGEPEPPVTSLPQKTEAAT
jgi:hypothetical protein